MYRVASAKIARRARLAHLLRAPVEKPRAQLSRRRVNICKRQRNGQATQKNCPAIELLVRTVFRPHCALLTKSLLLRNVCFGIEGGVGVDVIPYIESGWGADVHATINNRTGIGIAQRSRGGMVGA